MALSRALFNMGLGRAASLSLPPVSGTMPTPPGPRPLAAGRASSRAGPSPLRALAATATAGGRPQWAARSRRPWGQGMAAVASRPGRESGIEVPIGPQTGATQWHLCWRSDDSHPGSQQVPSLTLWHSRSEVISGDSLRTHQSQILLGACSDPARRVAGGSRATLLPETRIVKL